MSIFGKKFADENFELKHTEPGVSPPLTCLTHMRLEQLQKSLQLSHFHGHSHGMVRVVCDTLCEARSHTCMFCCAGALHGQRGTWNQRLTILHLHRAYTFPRQQARCVRTGTGRRNNNPLVTSSAALTRIHQSAPRSRTCKLFLLRNAHLVSLTLIRGKDAMHAMLK
jgi:hypothetical protein